MLITKPSKERCAACHTSSDGGRRRRAFQAVAEAAPEGWSLGAKPLASAP